MRYYFSGIKSSKEFSWLHQAGIQRFLVDPKDVKNIVWDVNPDVIRDSGAYRAFKAGKSLDAGRFLETEIDPRFTLVVAPDVIGDMDTTLTNWNQVKHLNLPLLPVWQWGGNPSTLHQFLDEAPYVGIGGCQPWLKVQTNKRTQAQIKEDKQLRDENFRQLKAICEQHPQRLHLFGLCWERATEELADTLYSADSSHWLCGARTGMVIFKHTTNGHLSKAPGRALPFAQGWDSERMCVENARAIAQYLGEPCLPIVPA